MKRLQLVAAILLTGACTHPQPVEQSAAVPAAVVTTVGPELGALPPDTILTNDPARLVGTWHTLPSAIDVGGPEILVKISDDRIDASSSCVNFAWIYLFAGTRLTLSPDPVISCQRTLTAAEADFARTMGAATRVYHRGGRGLVFEGPLGRVVLFEHLK